MKLNSRDSNVIIFLPLLNLRNLHPQTKTCVCIGRVQILHYLIYIWYKLKNRDTFLSVFIVIILFLPIYIFLYMNALNFSSLSVDCTNTILLQYIFILYAPKTICITILVHKKIVIFSNIATAKAVSLTPLLQLFYQYVILVHSFLSFFLTCKKIKVKLIKIPVFPYIYIFFICTTTTTFQGKNFDGMI